MKDKNLIWSDCAQCAYKHLAAAYAELTKEGAAYGSADMETIFVARAFIALSEVKAGYTGNVDLAAGCLAAAEVHAEAERAIPYRQARMRLVKGDVEGAFSCIQQPDDGWVEAHITEALREDTLLEEGETSPEYLDRDEVIEWLSRKLQALRDVYDLGPAKEVNNE